MEMTVSKEMEVHIQLQVKVNHDHGVHLKFGFQTDFRSSEQAHKQGASSKIEAGVFCNQIMENDIPLLLLYCVLLCCVCFLGASY